MNEFPQRNLTDQYISQSFDNLLQYEVSESKTYVSDGLGNLISILTITASNAVTASYAMNSSIADKSTEQLLWMGF
jgi:hypothetical protein